MRDRYWGLHGNQLILNDRRKYMYSVFEIDRTESPPSCLPADLDKTNLIDATRVSDEWRRYYDTETGELHDGAAYYKQAQKQAGFP